MSDETIRTICWTVMIVAAIQATSTYLLVRALTTGRALFERRVHEPSRLVGLDR